jgi:hypothetical protein
MRRYRKQEIEQYRRSRAISALAVSLMLAAAALPAHGAQTIDDIASLDRTQPITISGEHAGTADLPAGLPDPPKGLIEKFSGIMGGGALRVSGDFGLAPVNGAVTITDNTASGKLGLAIFSQCSRSIRCCQLTSEAASSVPAWAAAWQC